MLQKSIKLSEGQIVLEKETNKEFTVLRRTGQDHILIGNGEERTINQRKLKLFYSIV